MRLPVIGGVQDGGSLRLPTGAEPGYTVILKGDGELCEQTTEYVFREEPAAALMQRRALVARDMKWPIFEGAAA